MLPPELHQSLLKNQIEVRADPITRRLYATDASIYQIEPLGVAFPRSGDELAACVQLAAEHDTPVLARGSGSSLAGQAIGRALILDCSRYLTRLGEFQVESGDGVSAKNGGQVTVEPGLILAALNKAAARYGLQFGPDPASAERATLGGSIANNASGAHSIVYGLCADHLLSAETVLADGSLATFGELSLAQADEACAGRSRFAALLRTALSIRRAHAETIRAGWPRVWRNASGYNLPTLLPGTPGQARPAPPAWQPAFNPAAIYNPQAEDDPPRLNLAPLLAGSEGTLAVIRSVTLRLVPLPRHTLLVVLAFAAIAEACDAVPELLAENPSAIELIPHTLIELARALPAYAPLTSFVQDLSPDGRVPPALLVVEFAGDDPAALRQKAQALQARPGLAAILAESAQEQARIWRVRKVGLGLLQSRPGDFKALSFIEDMAVPVERLGYFVREFQRILDQHQAQAELYAHASAGCLHIRPLLNLKTPAGRAALRSIAEHCAALVASLGGTMTGEHGDGLARSEWLERIYGPDIVALFRTLKQAADPKGLLNPGKIVDPPPMDVDLRIGPDYHTQGWLSSCSSLRTERTAPTLDFTRQEGLVGAIEQCNGAGVCRKADGVMCPSFQATQDEMYSTRGRANLLRALISVRCEPRFPQPGGAGGLAERADLQTDLQADLQAGVFQTLDLCLACKGCKSECPSGVDVAKLKYEFMHQYYRFAENRHRRKLRDYLFGYIGRLAPLAAPLGPLVNLAMRQPVLRRLADRLFGLSAHRPFPKFKRPAADPTVRSVRGEPHEPRQLSPAAPTVLLLRDTFNRYFYPETEAAALQALAAAGCTVALLPVDGAGRTLISKGFLDAAREHAQRLVAAIERLDPAGRLPVVGLEPSEIYSLRDEYPDLLPNDPRVTALAGRAWMIDEFLLRPGADGQARSAYLSRGSLSSLRTERTDRPSPTRPGKTVLLHGHCYQKAQPPAADGYPTGVPATVALLKAAGYVVNVVDDGCCGMAGAFGYESEHYALSQKVGELALFPAIRSAGANSDIIIVAAGVSCQAQIEDATGQTALHPIRLLV